MTQASQEKPRVRYWRSLQELQQTPEFEQFLHREFPVAASEYPAGVSRRRWIEIMGASIALSGAAGCRYSEELIAPFVVRPEGRVPGEMHSFATNFEWADRVYHAIVQGVDGRPLKIEGHREHPTSLGGTDVYSQAAMLSLYDPDRKSSVTQRTAGAAEEVTDEALVAYLAKLSEGLKVDGGRKLGVLIGPTRSPAVIELLKEVRQSYPKATFCHFDAVRGDAIRKATVQALGRVGEPVLELDQCKVIVSLDADILGRDRAMVRNANRYVQGRVPKVGKMSRLYVFESGYSNTGMAADTRLSLAPQQLIAVLAELERRVDAAPADAQAPASEAALDELQPAEKLERVLSVLAAELVANKGRAVIVVGEHLGPAAIAAGIRLNNKLDALNKTVRYPTPLDAELGELVDLPTFVEKLGSELSAAVVLAVNPAFTAPVDVDLGAALSRINDAIYLAEYDDETAHSCRWSIPAAHPLESWGDVLSDDGFYGVCQPQIHPLLGGWSRLDLLTRLLGKEPNPQSIVRKSADKIAGGSLSEQRWRKLLHNGFDAELKAELLPAKFSGGDDPIEAAPPKMPSAEVDQDSIDVVFVPADGVYDGRFANNGWLQEMPQSITKVTWDNVASMSPATARALNVRQGVMVALRLDADRSVELPVYELPGAAHGVVTVTYGYGRTRAGAVGGHIDLGSPAVGIDVRTLRTRDRMYWAKGIESRPRAAKEYKLGNTQDHFAIDLGGLEETKQRAPRLIREGTLEHFEKEPGFVLHMGEHAPYEKSLWNEPMEMIMDDPERATVPQWGMSIDLNKCIGCNACVIACQAENNVPIVGKEQVAMGREMHWLRLDRYFVGDEEDPQMVSEPVACMHCETAPCEQVCPVAATVHTDDGINTMAYNRCIGTRYCGNNCPFKVRRFNYFNFNQDYGYGYGWNAFPENLEKANRKLQALVLNPEVTVRGRGVMEKCTYCIQRVEHGKIEARKDGGRAIRDGEVQSACQTACPTHAIVFGNIKDESSEVHGLHHDDRSYAMLDHLNVKPRTRYMARIRNPHPRLMTAHQRESLQNAGGHGAAHGDHHEEKTG